jgi:hypothetical protein
MPRPRPARTSASQPYIVRSIRCVMALGSRLRRTVPAHWRRQRARSFQVGPEKYELSILKSFLLP